MGEAKDKKLKLAYCINSNTESKDQIAIEDESIA